MSLLTRDMIAALRASPDTNMIEHELLAEKASSLGHHGRLVEKALDALRRHDADGGRAEDRSALVIAAAREVWAFLVQRELCGLRDQNEIVRFYRIPTEVMARLGAQDRPATSKSLI